MSITSKKQKMQLILLCLSGAIIILGILFLLTASKMVPIFTALYNIPNMILQYIIVIGTMSVGIMLFSNISAAIENKHLRDRLTIFITIFAFVLTLPLLYVFIALFPAMNGKIGPVGEIMVKDIALDFQNTFKSRALQSLIYSLGIVMAVVFLAFPLFTGILTLKDKALIIGKSGINIGELPSAKKLH